MELFGPASGLRGLPVLDGLPKGHSEGTRSAHKVRCEPGPTAVSGAALAGVGDGSASVVELLSGPTSPPQPPIPLQSLA